ncbi:MAG: hypothetical protein A3I39_01960 [Candidatus Yanofskybacteria bacterium RIFCSPLOWO2_02_FULL_47_9b]|uniref:Glutamyl-tRNA amidotransferase n=1 Tax=Candidatus Yanofskybacteria bacterium RIFCSPLOWO2_02_FULL_47_9b TaxID=1802708 RepID=A0A1F8H845_9BACT|nr:MAG: hypothetical protein A3I39_01960 [Candidatus Yanofskybacteria bacterium RIFCSPLOWO2_02_FULL_47_9b]
MTLKEKLKEDMKIALKAGDAATRSLMGMVLSAVKNKEIEKKSELNDEEVVAVIASEVKKRKDSIIQFEKGGRLELAADEQKEIDALMIYMPAQLSDDVVREAVKKAIAETGATTVKDMGKVISSVMAKIKGQAEGSKVSQFVKEELAR